MDGLALVVAASSPLIAPGSDAGRVPGTVWPRPEDNAPTCTSKDVPGLVTETGDRAGNRTRPGRS